MQLNLQTASILNNLVRLNADRVKGYNKVARHIEIADVPLKNIFTKVAGDSADCISQLFPYIIQSGMQPAVNGGNSEVFQSLERNLLDSNFQQHNRKTVKADDFDQDGIIEAYYQALNNTQLPAEVYNIINEQTLTLRNTRSAILDYCAS